jgi:outer membrane protein OmpA-like peptidoglycan-associated protein
MKTILYNTFLATAALIVFAGTAHAQVIGTVVTVRGIVIDEINRNPASVNLTFFDDQMKKVNSSRSNAKDGEYLVTGLKPGKKYTVQIEHPDFFKAEYTIKLPATDKYAEVSRDFLVKPLAMNTRIFMRLSPFEVKKSKIRVGAGDLLEDFKRSLIMNPNVAIEIQCFPDAELDKATNEKLTADRCKTLQDYFVKGGVPAERLKIKPTGATDPVNAPPPPSRKLAKGKRYVGSTYFVITKV